MRIQTVAIGFVFQDELNNAMWNTAAASATADVYITPQLINWITHYRTNLQQQSTTVTIYLSSWSLNEAKAYQSYIDKYEGES
jgi:hypothetical protein